MRIPSKGFGGGYSWVLLRIQVMDLQEYRWRTMKSSLAIPAGIRGVLVLALMTCSGGYW